MFTDRKLIAKQYRKWLREHNAIDCAENLIVFLCENNLMDLEAVNKFLEVQNDMFKTM
jgi:hypothetical protein